MSKRNSLIIGTVLLALVLFGVEWRAEARFRSSASTALYFLDVGQGDATLIRDGMGRVVLIDGGPGDRVIEGLERRLPAWERDIDLVILTHLDADHFTGLFDVIERYHIGEVWWNGATPTTAGGYGIIGAIRAKGVPMKVVKSGERFGFAEASMTVIHPDGDLTGAYLTDKNAESVSVRIDCGKDVALLAGDVPIGTEEDFVTDGDIGDIALLKVSHHGSKHSTSGAFLDAVTPEYAVISSGKGNRYGHPASRVLIDLRKRGIETFRTDTAGDIGFVCDGTGFTPS